jgi:type VI secretion system FHA domain protein
LILSILPSSRQPSGADTVRRLDGGQLSIGRGNDNDWVLPDPERVLSRQHCLIKGEGETFVLIDRSSYGVFLNDAAEPVGSGNSIPLQDGDRIRLGDYEIEVRFEKARRQGAEATRFGDDFMSVTRLFADDEGPGLRAAEGLGTHIPEDFADFGAPPPPPQKPQRIADLESGIPLDEAFRPPRPARPTLPDDITGLTPPPPPVRPAPVAPPPVPEPPAAKPPMPPIPEPPAPLAAGTGIPDDFDAFLASLEGPEAAPPVTPVSPPPASAPIAAKAPTASQAGPLPDDLDFLFEEAPAKAPPPVPTGPIGEPKPAPAPARPAPPIPTMAVPPLPPFDEPAPPTPVTVAGRVRPEPVPPAPAWAREEPAPPPPPPPPSPPPAAAGDALIQAFLKGARLDPAKAAIDDPARLMQTLGEILHLVVADIIAVLKFRQKIKKEFRSEVTEFAVTENNPLKLWLDSADEPLVEERLEMLFGKRQQRYMGPNEAFREAFGSIVEHEVAIVAGTREIWFDLLRRFDPKALEQRLGEDSGLGGLLTSKKARCWDAFVALYQSIIEDVTNENTSLFNRAFSHAYEQQVAKQRGGKP